MSMFINVVMPAFIILYMTVWFIITLKGYAFSDKVRKVYYSSLIITNTYMLIIVDYISLKIMFILWTIMIISLLYKKYRMRYIMKSWEEFKNELAIDGQKEIDEMSNLIGKIIKLRIDLNLSILDVAKLTNMKEKEIEDIETLQSTPDMNTVLFIIETLQKKRNSCVGCGFCCIKAQCGLGQFYYGKQERCSGLVWEKNRYYCKLVLDNIENAYQDLYIDCGCCSNLNTWRNKVKER